MSKTIMFVGGGTLGHIYPSLPVIVKWHELYPNDRIVFIACKKIADSNVLKQEMAINKTYYINVRGLNRKKPWKNIGLIFKIPKDLKKIKKIIKVEKPHVVIGMGGVISGLVTKVAHLTTPIILHEQNAVVGFANRLMMKKAKYVLTSYPLNLKKVNTVWIGNPRMDFAKKMSKKKETNNIKKILIVSGSQGAKRINEVVIEFLQDDASKKYCTTLITGKRYFNDVLEVLKITNSTHFQIMAFSYHLLEIMNEADLIITRAGGTTLSEIIGLNKKMLIIPSPNVTNNHQVKNAKMLINQVNSLMIEEKDLNKNNLIEKIEELFKSKALLSNKYYELEPTKEFIKKIEEVTLYRKV